jgi:hypothetical protein
MSTDADLQSLNKAVEQSASFNLVEMQAILENMNPDLLEKLMPKLTQTCNKIKEKVSTGKSDAKSMDIMNSETEGCVSKLQKLTE